MVASQSEGFIDSRASLNGTDDATSTGFEASLALHLADAFDMSVQVA